jgi:hypothetical protein
MTAEEKKAEREKWKKEMDDERRKKRERLDLIFN